MFIFTAPETNQKEVKKRCSKFKTMTVKQLRDHVKNIDKSENKTLISHSSMKTKKQILDFLFTWEYCQLNGGFE
jgi:hypothetical protein